MFSIDVVLQGLCAFVVAASTITLSPAAADEASERRLAYMRKAAQSMTVLAQRSESTFPLHPKPILRFGDATRQASDGGLWKWGEGRPKFLVAMEFTWNDDRMNLYYEFLALTEEVFELRTDRGWRWNPKDSAIRFQSLPGAPAPGRTQPQRLLQLRSAARRFSASELYQGEVFQLRLMPQPIHRYQIDEKNDGAVFAFVNGTNPEALLLIESDGDSWQYGLARLCGARPTVKLDGKEVWTLPDMSEVGKSWTLNYTGDAHEVDEL